MTRSSSHPLLSLARSACIVAAAGVMSACGERAPTAGPGKPPPAQQGSAASVAVKDSAAAAPVVPPESTAAPVHEVAEAPPYTGPSTLNGLYTDAQAARGKDVYAGSCRSCHTPESHTGATFATWWRGKQLSDLYNFIATRMPKNDPGSLAPEDVADVLAYLLKMNALPTGPNELYPDPDSLKQYRIETRRSGRASTAKRTKP